MKSLSTLSNKKKALNEIVISSIRLENNLSVTENIFFKIEVGGDTLKQLFSPWSHDEML